MSNKNGNSDITVSVHRELWRLKSESGLCYYCRGIIKEADRYVTITWYENNKERIATRICLTCAVKIGAASRGENHKGQVISNLTGNEAYMVTVDRVPVQGGIDSSIAIMDRKAAFAYRDELRKKYSLSYSLSHVHVYMKVNKSV